MFEGAVYLAGELALEAANGLAAGLAITGASGQMVLGFAVAAFQGEGDVMQSPVQHSIFERLEPVAGVFATASLNRTRACFEVLINGVS
ncbi:hypothetical protein [Nonomuraea sp. NPDC001699]